MFIPIMANAQVITEASEPEYYEDMNVLAANGTPVIITLKDGNTYVTWEGGEQLVNAQTVVVGGYYNPYTDENVTIELASTSVTMNSGTVDTIVGGNMVVGSEKSYDNYDKIYVGKITVDINGGALKEVSAVSVARKMTDRNFNTAVPASKYGKDFYYADDVLVSIDDAVVNGRVVGVASYVYAKNLTINITNSTVNHDANGVSVMAGTNGVVDSFLLNVKDSQISNISAGQRVMVEEMSVNVTGDSVIGDIYAGSFYPETEFSGQDWWNNIKNVNYGQVGEIIYTFDENVVYNNIYAGFQFVEMDKFKETFEGNAALETFAKGISGSENAKVVINIKTSPKVVGSDLVSMIDGYKKENVTVNYTPVTDIPVIDPSEDTDEPIFGIIDKDEVDIILGESIQNNDDALGAVADGKEVSTAIEIEAIKEPSQETVQKVEEIANSKGNSVIVGYFDINVLIKADGSSIGTIDELTKPISLSVLLPNNIEQVKDGYQRQYYIVREHNGEVELLEASLSSDGKTLSFESDKFSTYALMYVDTLVADETPSEPSEVPNVPQTFDHLTVYVAVGVFSIIAIGGAVIYLKRKNA